jgi:hypothetical protein
MTLENRGKLRTGILMHIAQEGNPNSCTLINIGIYA